MTGTEIALAAAGLLLASAIALELGQRLSDRLKRSRRRAARSPRMLQFHLFSERGVALNDKPGALVLVLHPYVLYRAQPGQRLDGLTINSLGYRGEEWTKEKRPDAVRILVVGSSIAFGAGVSDEQVFPAVLERLLRELAPDRRVEVLNGAGLGYNSSQQLVALATELLDYTPDVVIVSGGLIDFNAGRLAAIDRSPVNPVYDRIEEVLFDGVHRLRNTLRLSALYRGLERRIEALRPGPARSPQMASALPARDHPGGAARYCATLERMCHLARGAGAKVLILTEAESHLRRVDPVPAAELALRRSKGPAYEEAILAHYPLYVQAGEDVARALGLEHFDLTQAFHDVKDALFVDWVHPNALGHRLIARAIAPSVAALGGLAGEAGDGSPGRAASGAGTEKRES